MNNMKRVIPTTKPVIAFTETTRKDYSDMLGAVPPKLRKYLGFLAGEAYSDRVCQVTQAIDITYQAYFQIGEHFFAAGPLTVAEFQTVTHGDVMAGSANNGMRTVASDTRAAGTILHRFEEAGLGKAPFRCIGVSENMWSPCPGEPARPGGACSYCGQGIRYEYMVKDVEGKRFKVGGDCIRKVGDTGLLKTVKAEERERRLEKAKLERIRYRAILDSALDHPLTRDLLAERPHPRNLGSDTLLQYVEFMRLHAGLTGLKATAKILANLLV